MIPQDISICGRALAIYGRASTPLERRFASLAGRALVAWRYHASSHEAADLVATLRREGEVRILGL